MIPDSDDNFEYRHVILPKQMLKLIPKEYDFVKRDTVGDADNGSHSSLLLSLSTSSADSFILAFSHPAISLRMTLVC